MASSPRILLQEEEGDERASLCTADAGRPHAEDFLAPRKKERREVGEAMNHLPALPNASFKPASRPSCSSSFGHLFRDGGGGQRSHGGGTPRHSTPRPTAARSHRCAHLWPACPPAPCPSVRAPVTAIPPPQLHRRTGECQDGPCCASLRSPPPVCLTRRGVLPRAHSRTPQPPRLSPSCRPPCCVQGRSGGSP